MNNLLIIYKCERDRYFSVSISLLRWNFFTFTYFYTLKMYSYYLKLRFYFDTYFILTKILIYVVLY
ncbi:hypothetical protein C2G38_2007589 [Gigaspora rosea]|uniref:Uncharacterized protein n=1 Tax=Gigaspora rosea TaxID=44941 RepID=A0A397UF23_9GLOM|nr:hypothetical protein C2G38_2007589 [Gigaspora rosea]